MPIKNVHLFLNSYLNIRGINFLTNKKENSNQRFLIKIFDLGLLLIFGFGRILNFDLSNSLKNQQLETF